MKKIWWVVIVVLIIGFLFTRVYTSAVGGLGPNGPVSQDGLKKCSGFNFLIFQGTASDSADISLCLGWFK